ncbi:MAG: YsnF/AvaK domain-containing protein [Ferruginibacter sp.]|nr:YsnF/AvaK domain-containing protein [Cytophagales bacterium]
MENTADSSQQPGVAPQPAENQLINQGASQPVVIRVIEEQIRIDKKVVESARVRISKRVSEHEESVDISLVHEEVDVERVAVNQYVETPPSIRYEGDTTIIPVLREVAVVEKRLLLVEELRVTKRHVQTNETQQLTLRREDIQVERTVSEPANPEMVRQPNAEQSVRNPDDNLNSI